MNAPLTEPVPAPAPEDTRRPTRGFWLALGLALLVGVSVRSAVVLAFPDMAMHGDETEFVTGARELLAGEDVSCIPFRPPLYIWLCAVTLAASGDSPDAIRFVQIALEALSILGIALLGCLTIGRRAGACAAWLYALYPDFITYSHYLWSETLATTLLVWGLLALVRMHARPGWRTALVVRVAVGRVDARQAVHALHAAARAAVDRARRRCDGTAAEARHGGDGAPRGADLDRALVDPRVA